MAVKFRTTEGRDAYVASLKEPPAVVPSAPAEGTPEWPYWAASKARAKAPKIESCYPNQSTEHFTAVRLEAPKEDGPTHKCKLPGWWQRRKSRLKLGAIIYCNVCKKRYEFSKYTVGDGTTAHSWARIDREPPVPPLGPPGQGLDVGGPGAEGGPTTDRPWRAGDRCHVCRSRNTTETSCRTCGASDADE